MDYVYICRNGENEELRYSLRSTVKNLPSGRVWIVGGKPDWYVGNFIDVPQDSSKYINARRSLAAIVNSDLISDNFVLMNDDFYTIKRTSTIESYHRGDMMRNVAEISYFRQREQTKSQSYLNLLILTFRVLRRMEVRSPIDYETHTPMVISKESLGLALKTRALWRSFCGNRVELGGTEVEDVKIYEQYDKKRREHFYSCPETPYLSTNDHTFAVVLEEVLESLFPTPSVHEAV